MRRWDARDRLHAPTVDTSGSRSCTPPATTLNPSCGFFAFYYGGTPAAAPNVCSSDSFSGYGFFDRSKHGVGSTFTPTTGDTFYFSQTTMGVNRSCSSWTGTMHWVSDVPAWQVDVDVTCSSTPSVHVVGTFHGML